MFKITNCALISINKNYHCAICLLDIVIFDLEWNGVYNKAYKRVFNEIIEIGAVKCNSDLQILGTFEQMIKPSVNDKIDTKIVKLTGISDSDVKRGVDYKTAFEAFNRFAGNAIFTTFGMTDLHVLCENNHHHYGDNDVPIREYYFDVQDYLTKRLRPTKHQNQLGLQFVADKLDIDTSPYNVHRALDDSLLTLNCFRKAFDKKFLQGFLRKVSKDFFERLMYKDLVISDINDPNVDLSEFNFICPDCRLPLKRTSEIKYTCKFFSAGFCCTNCKKRYNGMVRFTMCFDNIAIRKKFFEIKNEETN